MYFQVVGSAELLEGIRDIVAVSACRIQFLKALCQNVFFIPDIKGPEKEVIDQPMISRVAAMVAIKSVGNSFFDGVFSSFVAFSSETGAFSPSGFPLSHGNLLQASPWKSHFVFLFRS